MQGVQGPRAARAARASLAGGVRRRVGHVQLCVGMARGGREARNARRARVPVAALRSPPWGNPLCVCVCVFVRHTARRRLWGVGAACEEAAGRRESPVRRYTTGGGPPPAQRRMCVRAFAGLRGGARRASWSHKCLRAGVHYQRTKRKQTGAVQGSQRGACASARPPDPVAEGSPAQRPGDERAASVNLTLTRGWCVGRAATGSYPVPSSRHRAL